MHIVDELGLSTVCPRENSHGARLKTILGPPGSAAWPGSHEAISLISHAGPPIGSAARAAHPPSNKVDHVINLYRNL